MHFSKMHFSKMHFSKMHFLGPAGGQPQRSRLAEGRSGAMRTWYALLFAAVVRATRALSQRCIRRLSLSATFQQTEWHFTDIFNLMHFLRKKKSEDSRSSIFATPQPEPLDSEKAVLKKYQLQQRLFERSAGSAQAPRPVCLCAAFAADGPRFVRGVCSVKIKKK